jgi:UDP-glucose 4-epimerase
MTKALITGGGGFIGLHLARRLQEKGAEVDLLDNFSRGSKDADLEEVVRRPGVRLLERDLLGRDWPEHLDSDYRLIFHLAAIVGVAKVLEAPYRVLRDNVALLVPLLELAADQPRLERFVFASTSEVYAGTLELGTLPIPTPEEAPLALPGLDRPRTSYMLSKVYGEALCHHADIPTTVIRPHNVYGPRMGLAHVIPELLQRAHEAREGGTLQVFSVDHRRTFCHVRDAVEIITIAAQSPACEGETLNVGTQSPEITIGRLAEIILEVVGRQLEVEPLPATQGSPGRRCPDMTKTTRLTGYEARVRLEEGVRDTYSWYRDRVLAPSSTRA